jgi:MFS family permease
MPFLPPALRRYLGDKLASDPLLRNPDFRRYWLSSVLNSFGAQISALAVPLCSALLLHATPGQMGIIAACQALPYALFALPAGVWLDRRRKLPILLVSRLLQGALLASIPLGWWLGMLSMHWLYAVTFLFATCGVLSGAAEQIFLNLLVGRQQLIEAQSKFATTDSISRLVAPGLAGLLVQWLTAPFAILFDAASFFISAWNLRKTQLAEPAPVPSDKHPLRDIASGFAFIWHEPLLRTLAWGAALWHFFLFGYSALLILLATRELGMTAGMLGAAQMLGGLGVFLSAVLVKRLNRRYGAGKTFLVGTCGTVAGFALMPAIPASLFGNPVYSAAAFGLVVFMYDCAVMLFFIPFMALRMKATPDAYTGRVISTMRFLTGVTGPVGALAAGYLGDHYGIRTGMACVAAGGIVLAAALVMSHPLRSVAPDQP